MGKVDVKELGTNKVHTPIEYIYVTIPAEYVCVYHRILAMLADYGIDMLKDCKASCTDRNSGVIECFNTFNAAVAARKLGNEKLAETLIKYIKAKINQIYKGKDNSTSFVFPVDENGEIKAFVSCNDTPLFAINPNDGELYEHKFHKGFDEHYALGKEDNYYHSEHDVHNDLDIIVEAYYETNNLGETHPCADVNVYLNGYLVDLTRAIVNYYFDDMPVVRLNDVTNPNRGFHKITVVVKYEGMIAVNETYKEF